MTKSQTCLLTSGVKIRSLTGLNVKRQILVAIVPRSIGLKGTTLRIIRICNTAKSLCRQKAEIQRQVANSRDVLQQTTLLQYFWWVIILSLRYRSYDEKIHGKTRQTLFCETSSLQRFDISLNWTWISWTTWKKKQTRERWQPLSHLQLKLSPWKRKTSDYCCCSQVVGGPIHSHNFWSG